MSKGIATCVKPFLGGLIILIQIDMPNNHSAIYVPPILPTPSQLSSKYSTGIKNIISSYSLMEMLDLGQ